MKLTGHPTNEWRSGAYPRRPEGVEPIAITIPPPKRGRWHAAVVMAIALAGTLGLVLVHGLLVQLGGRTGAVSEAITFEPTQAIQMAAGQAAAIVEPIESEDEPPAPFDVGVVSFILSRAAKRAAVLCELRGGPSEAKLAIAFAPDGKVARADVLEDWSDTPPGRCFAREIAAAQIVPFDGDATELRFTLQLF
ncbi:MAG TPA: hypothetical protein VFB62_08050 [Polyangiaceae bacterium]|nr:hypothetical protein [Polyangiaceae bacterium]